MRSKRVPDIDMRLSERPRTMRIKFSAFCLHRRPSVANVRASPLSRCGVDRGKSLFFLLSSPFSRPKLLQCAVWSIEEGSHFHLRCPAVSLNCCTTMRDQYRLEFPSTFDDEPELRTATLWHVSMTCNELFSLFGDARSDLFICVAVVYFLS